MTFHCLWYPWLCTPPQLKHSLRVCAGLCGPSPLINSSAHLSARLIHGAAPSADELSRQESSLNRSSSSSFPPSPPFFYPSAGLGKVNEKIRSSGTPPTPPTFLNSILLSQHCLHPVSPWLIHIVGRRWVDNGATTACCDGGYSSSFWKCCKRTTTVSTVPALLVVRRVLTVASLSRYRPNQ